MFKSLKIGWRNKSNSYTHKGVSKQDLIRFHSSALATRDVTSESIEEHLDKLDSPALSTTASMANNINDDDDNSEQQLDNNVGNRLPRSRLPNKLALPRSSSGASLNSNSNLNMNFNSTAESPVSSEPGTRSIKDRLSINSQASSCSTNSESPMDMSPSFPESKSGITRTFGSSGRLSSQESLSSSGAFPPMRDKISMDRSRASDSRDDTPDKCLDSPGASNCTYSSDSGAHAIDSSSGNLYNMSQPSSGMELSFDKSLDTLMEKLTEKQIDNLSQHSLNLRSESKSGSFSASDSFTASSKLDDLSVSVSKSSKSEKKKKSSSWYTVLSPTYKSRSEDFKRIFKNVPNERLIVDYSCALQKDILVHGRLFISQNWVCFYANIFRWETILTISCKDITAVTKEKTARVIPNAIQVTTTTKEKYFFTTFAARDKAFLMLFRLWQNALLDNSMSTKELWQWIHYSYGDDLGLTSSDEDYVPPPNMDDVKEKLGNDENGQNVTLSTTKDTTVDELLELAPNGDLDSGMSMTNCIAEEDSQAVVPVNDARNDDVFTPPSPLTMDSTLDNGDADLPTDNSDTTEDDDGRGELLCAGHDHLEKTYLDEVFSITVDKMFEYLFTDSSFFREFVTARKTFDLVLPSWQEETDKDGNRVRHISYTLTLGEVFGPKTSPSEETQICFQESKPGHLYLVDAHCVNNGIPLSGAFYVINRYCLTRVSNQRCRVRVTSEVRYNKSLWGVVKNMVERSAAHGLKDYFQALTSYLKRESNKLEHQLQPGKRTSKKKRRRRASRGKHSSNADTPRQIDTGPTPPTGTCVRSKKRGDVSIEILPRDHERRENSSFHKEHESYWIEWIHKPYTMNPVGINHADISFKEERILKLNSDTLVRMLLFIIVMLMFTNAFLCYKLWSIEDMANSMYYPDAADINIINPPSSQDEWMKLLRQQHHLHEMELSKWRELLGNALSILDQMKRTLSEVHIGLTPASQGQATFSNSDKSSVDNS